MLETRTIQSLPLDCIRPGPNDRTDFPEGSLRELAASLAAHGLAQPVTVRELTQDGEGIGLYELVAGERRTRAARLLGWTEIPAIVADLTEERASGLMLVENLAREDLNPVSEARAYQTRMSRFGWTIEEVALQGGVSPRRIQNRLRLLSLRADILALVRTGDLSLGYAQILAEASLDANRQGLALQRLQANPSPAPSWFRRQCGELKAAQAQEALLCEDFALCAPAAPAAAPAAPALPPVPGEAEAPRQGRTAEAILKGQVSFWTQAAAGWDELGKPVKRASCLAAAAALGTALEILAAIPAPAAPAAPSPRTDRQQVLAALDSLNRKREAATLPGLRPRKRRLAAVR